MLDVVAKITEAESLADEKKKAAAGKARQTAADAHKQGEKLLEEVKAEALKRSASELAKLENQTKEMLENRDAECRKECETILAEARKRLGKAAEIIVERIVSEP